MNCEHHHREHQGPRTSSFQTPAEKVQSPLINTDCLFHAQHKLYPSIPPTHRLPRPTPEAWGPPGVYPLTGLRHWPLAPAPAASVGTQFFLGSPSLPAGAPQARQDALRAESWCAHAHLLTQPRFKQARPSALRPTRLALRGQSEPLVGCVCPRSNSKTLRAQPGQTTVAFSWGGITGQGVARGTTKGRGGDRTELHRGRGQVRGQSAGTRRGPEENAALERRAQPAGRRQHASHAETQTQAEGAAGT